MSQPFQPAKTIDEVITRLDELIAWAAHENSAHGIFPALYVVVTEKIRDGIAQGDVFENGVRMEALDVYFANGFLRAFHNYQNDLPVPACWQLAFDTAGRFPRKLILQQLLVGMNAHINYDLGIASHRISAAGQLEGLKDDFDAINTILAALVEGIKQDLIQLSPRFGLLLRRFEGKEDVIMNFSVKRARIAAWKFAQKLAKTRRSDRMERLELRRDEITEKIGERIVKPGLVGRLVVWWVKRSEEKDIAVILRKLRKISNERLSAHTPIQPNA